MRKQTPSGAALIIAEKPTAAQRIAEALDENGSPKKKKGKKVEYYLARRNAEKIIVCPALGHLYTVLDTRRDKSVYPSLVTSWVSRDLAERNSKQIKTWLQDISTASEEAEVFYSACDYDIEGSLIGALVLKYACNGKNVEARRMKFSTLTKNEIISAYEKASPKQDLTLVEAGEARHEVDFLFGINLSRFLTVTHKNNSGKHVTLSVGRVQSPTLSFVVDRDREIKSYVPLPYYEIRPVFQIGEQVIEAEYSEKIVKNKSAAERIISECRDKKGIVREVSEKTIRRSPPVPFDLGSLQRAAYTHFRFTPSRTLAVLERLYLEALISYPRTGSQKLPEALGLPEKIQSLTHFKEYEALAKSLIANRLTKPNEGKKEDPAHPAVHPTGNVAERALSEDERKIFDLVVKRFLSTFASSAVLKSTRVTIAIGEYAFRVGGLIVEEEGWMKFLKPYVETDQRLLPQVSVGMAVPLLEITESLKYTSPPPHYNPASLLKVMEESGIGTKCLTADTKIFVSNSGETKLVPISQLFAEGKSSGTFQGTEISLNQKYACFSINSAKPVESHFLLASRRPLNEDETVFEIIFSDGSRVRLTEDHPVCVYDDGVLAYRKARFLKQGVKVAALGSFQDDRESEGIIAWEDFLKRCRKRFSLFAPAGHMLKEERLRMGLSQHRLADLVGASRGNVSSYECLRRDVPLWVLKILGVKPLSLSGVNKNMRLPNPFPIIVNASFARILAHLIGDGSIDRTRVRRENCFDFRYHNKDSTLVERFIDDMGSIFKVRLKMEAGGRGRYYVRVPGVVGRILSIIAPEIVSKDAPTMIGRKSYPYFIGGLFDDEGHVSRAEAKLFICNTNHRLLRALKLMMGRLGIQTSLDGKSHKLFVRGKDNIEAFLEKIPIGSVSKKQRLINILSNGYQYKGSCGPLAILERQILGLTQRRPLSMIDISHLMKLSKSVITRRVRRLLRRGYLRKIVLGNNKDKPRTIKYQAERPLRRTFYAWLGEQVITPWLITKEVKAISEVPYQGYVYDISNSTDTPNFALENGVIVHNSTRSEVIETLYNRGYIRVEQMEVTPLGYSIIELLNKSSSLITSADMTRDLEEKMSKIELGEMSRQEVLVQSGEIVVNILEDLKKRDALIAEQLAVTVNQTRLEAITVGKCPVCGTGELRIVRSRRTKKRFIGCSNYWNKTCTNSAPLPQSGQVLRTNRSCQVCSWPMITVKSRGRRPWNTCINPNCASKLRVKEKKRELLPEIERMQGNPGGSEEEVSGAS